MTSATYSPAQSPLFQTLQNISLIIATSAATLVALVILNKIINRFFYVADYRILVPIPAACVFAVFFLRARYADFIPMFRIALRCSAAGLLAVLIFAPPQFTLANPEATLAADYVHYAYYPVFAIAVAALFRPSFCPRRSNLHHLVTLSRRDDFGFADVASRYPLYGRHGLISVGVWHLYH